jgi:hypothetical protein
MFKRKEKVNTNLELASHYTISQLLKDTEMVFFKVGRKRKDYVLTETSVVLQEVKHSFVGADISKKNNKWYVCIPYISDIV